MQTLLLIDANALVHRCFHALPPFTGPKGQPTGALYGLSSILIKILREPPKKDFITALFDRPEPTFRKEIFEDYKIHRPKAPDALVSQIIEAHKLFGVFGIKIFEMPGFEADDLIGTMVEKFKNQNDLKIVILSGDLDTLQLVENDNVVAETLKIGVSQTIIYNSQGVKEKYGVSPEQMPDYKALVGDASDNIPGVPGIGPKTAAILIQKYQTIENLLRNCSEEKSCQKILNSEKQVLLSKELSKIRRDVPLPPTELNDLQYQKIPLPGIIEYFKALGFQGLIKRLETTDF